MGKRLKTPHDVFTQLMLEIQIVALAFFKANLPKDLVEALDWATLTIADAVVRPEGRKALFTDMLYRVYTRGSRASVYLHVEQERKIDLTMPVRTTQYESAINLKHFKQGHKKLGLIYHIVLYNGNSKVYPDPSDLESRFERPDLVEFFPNISRCPFKLVNLNLIGDKQLAAQGPCGLMTLLLKNGRNKNFRSWMAKNKELLRSLTTTESAVVSCFDYIYNVSEEDPKKIVDIFVEVYPEQKEDIMTARIKDRRDAMQQGVRRGRREGMQEGRFDVARNMLQGGAPVAQVCKWTGLDAAYLNMLLQEMILKK
ncbi:MAG: Rpn family recombination-promoting nuclease/putative transposase [Bacteroidota bacterium]